MTTENKKLTTFSEEDIKKSQALAGQSIQNVFPFIPVLTVNNKEEKRKVEVDGVETEVGIPPVKGFNKLTKDKESGKYQTELLKGDIYGVILKERYQIEKKYNPNAEDVSVNYRSDEFDNWGEQIFLHNIKNRQEIVDSGTYSELKAKYTITDSQGSSKKDFNLFLILYINYNLTGKVYRLKIKMNSNSNWFDYKKTFKSGEAWASFITKFELKEGQMGDKKYWYVEMQRGDQVDLLEQIELQKEINKFILLQREANKKREDEKNILQGEEIISELKKDNESNFVQENDKGGVEIVQPKIDNKIEEMKSSEEINPEDIPF